MADEKQVTAENGNGEPVIKTAKQLEKEAAKVAKLAKLQQKQAAQAAQTAAQQSAGPKEKIEVSYEKNWLTLMTHTLLFHEFIFFFHRKKRK